MARIQPGRVGSNITQRKTQAAILRAAVADYREWRLIADCGTSGPRSLPIRDLATTATMMQILLRLRCQSCGVAALWLPALLMSHPERSYMLDTLERFLTSWPASIRPKMQFSSPRTELREIKSLIRRCLGRALFQFDQRGKAKLRAKLLDPVAGNGHLSRRRRMSRRANSLRSLTRSGAIGRPPPAGRPFTIMVAITVRLASSTTKRALARASTAMASDASADANSRCGRISAGGSCQTLTMGSIGVDTLCGTCSTSAAGRLNGSERSGLYSERRVPAYHISG